LDHFLPGLAARKRNLLRGALQRSGRNRCGALRTELGKRMRKWRFSGGQIARWFNELVESLCERGKGGPLKPVAQQHHLEMLIVLFYKAQQTGRVGLGQTPIEHSPLRGG
jgi:hypothetical protein